MFKRCIFLFLAINISSLYAILGGVGLHVAQDGFTVDQESFNYESISITRDAIDAPIGGGAFVYLTVIPFLDFEAGVSLTGAEYSYVFDGEESPTMGIAKFGWYLSAQRPVFKFPTIRMYAGAGINIAFGSPPVLLSEGRCVGGGSTLNSSLNHEAPSHIWKKWREI